MTDKEIADEVIRSLEESLALAKKQRDEFEGRLKAMEWVMKDNALRTYDGLTERVDKLEKSRSELRAALEFISAHDRSAHDHIMGGPIIYPMGQKAIEALAADDELWEGK